MTGDVGGAGAEGFDATLFARLAAAEPRSFWFLNRNRVIEWALARAFPRATSLLEVGCGTGFVLAGLRAARPDLRLVGTELFEEGLSFARRRLGEQVVLHQADARTLPYDGEFDVVGAFDVLEHIAQDREALAGLARAAKPGGGVLLTVPQHPWLWSAQDDFAHHQRRYTRRGLLGLMRGVGLEPLLVTSFVSLPLPAMAVTRRRRAGDGDHDVIDDLVPAAPVDRALRGVLALERGMLRAGVRFPAGGSLLVAGRLA